MGRRNIRVTLAYDGTGFQGWQVQAAGRTVQGELLTALERMHRHPVQLHAAGRTDSGVHAVGQVANFITDIDSIPAERVALALNSLLPQDVRVVDSREVAERFHARYDARRRTYRYYLLTAAVGAPHQRLYSFRLLTQPDVVRLNRLAARFVGIHDFSTFCAPTESSPSKVREVYGASFHVEGGHTVFTISANGFLWRMVRSIVGTLIELESRGAGEEAVSALIDSRDRSRAGTTAPPQGLFLYRVDYDEDAG
ncbi:tRNA pseudouridine(38-40) synthase TruA [Salinispira pacifica]